VMFMIAPPIIYQIFPFIISYTPLTSGSHVNNG